MKPIHHRIFKFTSVIETYILDPTENVIQWINRYGFEIFALVMLLLCIGMGVMVLSLMFKASIWLGTIASSALVVGILTWAVDTYNNWYRERKSLENE